MAWSFSIFFDKDGESQPTDITQLLFKRALNDQGVAADLTMNYVDFAIKAKLSSLERGEASVYE